MERIPASSWWRQSFRQFGLLNHLNRKPSTHPCTFATLVLRRTDMSDREGHVGSGSTDDDLSLPKATVAKMISGEFGSHTRPHCRNAVFKLPRIAPQRGYMRKRNP